MIIIDPSEAAANSPNERSPLKGGDLSPTTPVAPIPPPPPYVVLAQTPPGPPQFYQAVSHHPHHLHHPHHPHHSHHPHHPHHSPVPDHFHHHRRRSPFKRFIKAFGYAVLVLFLWGMFLESLNSIDKVTRKTNRSKGSSSVERVDKSYPKPDSVTPCCPCQTAKVPPTPGRVLPIQYPPVVAQAES